MDEDRCRFPDQGHAVLEAAAREVFLLMAGTDLISPEDHSPERPSEVVAMVGLAGELCGLLTVRCSRASALKIACHMLGSSENDAVNQAHDAMGEICNMVAGCFKAKIGLEDKCMLSVPTVIMGSNYEIRSLVAGRHIEIALLFHGRPVWFSMEIRS